MRPGRQKAIFRSKRVVAKAVGSGEPGGPKAFNIFKKRLGSALVVGMPSRDDLLGFFRVRAVDVKREGGAKVIFEKGVEGFVEIGPG